MICILLRDVPPYTKITIARAHLARNARVDGKLRAITFGQNGKYTSILVEGEEQSRYVENSCLVEVVEE